MNQKGPEDLDPEDVELDEHYTIETRSKCKKTNFFSIFVYSFPNFMFAVCNLCAFIICLIVIGYRRLS